MELILNQSWDLVSIEDYVNYTLILEDKKITDFRKQVEILALLAGKTYDDLKNIAASQIIPHFNALTFLLKRPTGDIKEFYEIGGKKYRLDMRIEKISAGQFIDLTHYTKDKNLTLDNLHLICATLLRPVRPFKGKKQLDKIEVEEYLETPLEETSENLFQNMPITEALGISNFFTLVLGLYFRSIRVSLKEQTLKIAQQALKILQTEQTPT